MKDGVESDGRSKLLPVKDCKESPTNPRTRFDKGQLTDLVESIKSHGILQPILVRPVNGHFEVVAGHRRLRATVLAGISTIPAIVKNLTDVAVLEVQIIENLQRADLHPLEEAEGYRQLMKLQQYTAEDLAVKVGKSKAYIYARVKLADLPEGVKKLFWEGNINPSVALLVARIPDASLAAKAAKEILQRRMSAREAADYIQREYMLLLRGAQFKTADAALVPKAGPCTTCPKRTGNQAELFSDVKNSDLCTDPACFQAKQKAAWVIRKAAAVAAGQKVIDDAEAKKLFSFDDHINYNAPYVKLDDRCDQDPKARNYRNLIGKHVTPALVMIPDTGRMVELVKKSELPAAFKAAGVRFERQTSSSGAPKKTEKEKAEELKAKETAAIHKETVRRAVAQMVAVVGKRAGGDAAIFRMILKSLLNSNPYPDHVTKRLEAEPGAQKGSDTGKTLSKAADKMTGGQLAGLIFELTVGEDQGAAFNDDRWCEDSRKIFREACTLLKVDLQAIEAQVRKERAAADADKPAPPAPKKGKKKK